MKVCTLLFLAAKAGLRRLLRTFARTQFGKQLAAQQIPAWSVYYVDYKGLKKVCLCSSNLQSKAIYSCPALGFFSRRSSIRSQREDRQMQLC